MEYGLLPVEVAISFMIILMLNYNKKEQFKSSKTTMYKAFLLSTFLYCFALFAGVLLLKYTGKNIISAFIWRTQGLFLFGTWIMYYFYCLITIYDISETNFFKLLFCKIEFKLLTFFLLVYFIAIFVPVYISLFDNVDANNIEIFTRDSSVTILILLIVSGISLFIRIFKYRNKLSNEFIFSTFFGCFICMLFCIFHMFYHDNTYLPLSFVIFAYVLYFSIENPDIILLHETMKLQKTTDNNDGNIAFLDGFNSDVISSVDKIIDVCDKVKKDGFNNNGENFEVILSESGLLLDKLNNIFDSSLIKREDVLNNMNYNVKDLINEVTLVLKEKISNKKIKLSLNFSPEMSSKLYGDYEKISQIYSSLISNACDSVTFGKIMISFTSQKNNDNELITFKIVDTGEGLSHEEQVNFYSNIDKCSAFLRKTKGLVDSLGGKMWFKSVERIGCTYFVQINQKIVDRTPIGTVLTDKKLVANEKIDYSKYRILIVDDDKMSLKLSERIFKKFGFDVILSNDGEDCINLIKSNEKFDMILMDIMMSDFSGVDVLNAIKIIEDYKIPPVIAFTANALSGMKNKYLSNGFDDYLEKPLKNAELMRVLNKYF